MDFENFDLLIGPENGRYWARVSLRGLGEASHGFDSPFEEGALEDVLSRIEVRQRDTRQAQGDHRTTLQNLGSRLFTTVFAGKVRSFWDTSLYQARQERKGVRLQLRLLSPELWDWPWEYLYDPDRDFLALTPDTSIVRYPEIPLPAHPLPSETPIRVLVATAHPKGSQRLAVAHEWDGLKGSLTGQAVSLKLLENASLSELRRTLRKPFHVLHFIGHGSFERDANRGVLLFEKKNGEPDRVTGRELARVLRKQPQLKLVVLNACEGARAARRDPFAGVAQALIKDGMPAVVAMQFQVTDEAAIAFSRAFYQSLGEGDPVDTAMFEARSVLMSERFETEWGNPVLYMRSPDGRIFDLSPVVATADPVPPDGHPQTSSSTEESDNSSTYKRLLAATLGAAALGGGYWLSTLPDRSTDPACPSPSGLEMPFTKIEPGRFLMGMKERPVQITRPFCLGRFEVTQGEWKGVMGTLPQQNQEGKDLPVGNVSWNDAQMFIAQLNAREPAAHYRLPTDAQWEYAARAGTSGRFSFGEEKLELRRYANCNKAGHLTPVGSLRKNPWGLYDMYGNVSEWVADWEAPLPKEPAVDPTGPPTGTEKIRRGGSFTNGAYCNSTFRPGTAPDRQSKDFGFRIVRDPVNKAP
jgi:formylglycine-generating enzyme required for sulfatase activity